METDNMSTVGPTTYLLADNEILRKRVEELERELFEQRSDIARHFCEDADLCPPGCEGQGNPYGFYCRHECALCWADWARKEQADGD